MKVTFQVNHRELFLAIFQNCCNGSRRVRQMATSKDGDIRPLSIAADVWSSLVITTDLPPDQQVHSPGGCLG